MTRWAIELHILNVCRNIHPDVLANAEIIGDGWIATFNATGNACSVSYGPGSLACSPAAKVSKCPPS
jgi:hypothetical protein